MAKRVTLGNANAAGDPQSRALEERSAEDLELAEKLRDYAFTSDPSGSAEELAASLDALRDMESYDWDNSGEKARLTEELSQLDAVAQLPGSAARNPSGKVRIPTSRGTQSHEKSQGNDAGQAQEMGYGYGRSIEP